jgi:hypothetical protein
MLTPDSFGPRVQDRVSITKDMVNPYLYDKIVVTEESEINLAPTPSTIVAGGSDIPDPFEDKKRPRSKKVQERMVI